MDLGLKDRVVCVTGSSSGIGRATAIAFGKERARVAVTYARHREGAEETARLVQEAGGESVVVHYDLARDDSIRSAVESVAAKLGPIEILVNNAVQWSSRGAPTGSNLFEDIPPDQWRIMLRTGLEGVYLTIQSVLPYMRAKKWGRIINISSSLAEDGLPGAGSYTAAKAGLHGLTRTLAQELGVNGILSNVVMPGMTLTERAQQVIPQAVKDQVASVTPTRRLTLPEEVASLVVYLASTANGHVNGERIRVTGGL